MPPELNTTEKLFKKHSSKPFNPKLAQVFFKSGMIEVWGRGFDKIREACERYNNAPLPEYDISETGVMVLCKPCQQYKKLLHSGVSVINYDRLMTDSLTYKEQENMKSILSYLHNNDTITNEKGRELTGKSESTVKRYLKRLCEIGILLKSGSNKHTVYTKVSDK